MNNAFALEAEAAYGPSLYRDLTLEQLSGRLGYILQPLPVSSAKRFYTDLTYVTDDIYSRTQKEYRWVKEGNRVDRLGALYEEELELPMPGDCQVRRTPSMLYHGSNDLISDMMVQVTVFDGDKAIFRPEKLNSVWRFFVDIEYAFGLRCCFLLDELEARLAYLATAVRGMNSDLNQTTH